MKIVHIIEPFAGGVVTFLKSLVENLPEDKHIVIHGERKEEMPLSEVKKQFLSGNVKFIHWKSAQRSLNLKDDIAASVELFVILKRLKKSASIDVVHLHSSKGGFIGRMVCRMLGIQNLVLYTPNGAPFLSGQNQVSNYMYKNLEKLASTFGGQVVCCSSSEQQAYELAGIDVLMINNGTVNKKTNNSTFSSSKKGKFRIVTSGRIENQKNPALFNKIASYFEELNQFEFLWIGEGSGRNLLTAKNITVTGWLAKEDLDEIITSADLYLSTSSFEGLPFSVLEALALKKPVLLSNCVGNKDLVLNGLNGSVFQHEAEAINKIVQFYNNASMLSVMGEYSSTHCESTFNQTDTYTSYKQLYQKTAYKHSPLPINLNRLAHGN